MPLLTAAAIFFRLTGVLVDPSRNQQQALTWWARARGIDPRQVLDDYQPDDSLSGHLHAVAPHLDLARERRAIDEWCARETNGVVVQPGASALLANLPPHRWAIVTAEPRRLAAARVRLVTATPPAALVTAEDVATPVPDPLPYRTAASRLGVPVQQCIVIDDTPDGIAAGKGAGALVIAVLRNQSPDGLVAADYLVRSLRDLRFIQLTGAGLTLDVTAIRPTAPT